MKPILIFRHLKHEGPGYFSTFLDERAIPYRIIAIDAGDRVPPDVDDAAALVFMGGSMSVNDPLPWIAAELALIRAAVARDMPVLGHCLGGQLISKALGGRVTRHPVSEIGWHPVTRVAGAPEARWRDAFPSTFDAFHWHGETFSIPPGAHRILASTACANQAFVIGNTLALQCHIEMTADMVHEWSAAGRDEIVVASPSVQSAVAMSRDLPRRIAGLQAVARNAYDCWLAPLRAQIH